MTTENKVSVTGQATVTIPEVVPQAMAEGQGVTQACRYNPYRSALLDAARASRGKEYQENRSLIVMDALDGLLRSDGLLPADARLQSELLLEKRKEVRT